jgi:putative hydrolase of the HAD superfamily
MIDWRKIKTVFLDMDGTLLDLHFDNYFWLEHVPQRYSETNNVSFMESREKLIGLFESHRGSLNWYCLDFWSDQLMLDIAALKEEVQHKIAIRPNAEIFLQRLQDNGKQVIIVTDAHHDSIKLKFRNTALQEKVDSVICSHDFQRPKQDPDFWRTFHQAKPFDLASTLFIDDNLSVLRAAQTYGFKNLLLVSQPDSQRPAQASDEFVALNDFSEIFPETSTVTNNSV